MTNPQLLRCGTISARSSSTPPRSGSRPSCKTASAEEVTYADFLDRLLTEEITATGEKAVAMRTVMARFHIPQNPEN